MEFNTFWFNPGQVLVHLGHVLVHLSQKVSMWTIVEIALTAKHSEKYTIWLGDNVHVLYIVPNIPSLPEYERLWQYPQIGAVTHMNKLGLSCNKLK